MMLVVNRSRVIRVLLAIAVAIVLGAWPVVSSRAAPDVVAPARFQNWVTNGSVSAVQVVGNTLYMGGYFTQVGPPTGGWVGLTALDATRRTDLPRVAGAVYAMTPDVSGGWYIGGEFTAVDGVPRSNLAHIRADLTLDPAWNLGTDGRVWALHLSGGTLYVGGEFGLVGGLSRSRIAAINAVTGGVTSWNPSISGTASAVVYAIAATSSAIYAGGYFSIANAQPRANLAGLDLASGVATSWMPNPNSTVRTLLLSGPNLFVGGSFSNISATARPRLAQFSTATDTLTSWNASVAGGFFNPSVNALLLDGSTLYVGGDFGQIGGAARGNLAALDLTTALATAWDPNVTTNTAMFPRVDSVAKSGGVVYVGGNFNLAGGQTRLYLAAVDASTGGATAWAANVGGTVSTIATSGDTVIIGGGFATVGGVSRNYLAAIDLTTGQPNGWNPNANSYVRDLVVTGDRAYVAGFFSEVGGQPHTGVAAVDLNTGLALPWNPVPNNNVNQIIVSGNTVYVLGSFSQLNTIGRFGIGALDATTGATTGWDPNPTGSPNTMALDGSTMWVGGGFAQIGGQPRQWLGAVSATTGLATAWTPPVVGLTASFPNIGALAVDANNLYVGGRFDTVGATSVDNLAALSKSTGALTAWHPSALGTTYPFVDKIHLVDDEVFVGGSFTYIGGQPRQNLAALDVATGSVRPWDPGFAGSFASVIDLDLGGAIVYAGGNFLQAGYYPQANIAGIDTTLAQTDAVTSVSMTGATLNGTVAGYVDPITNVEFVWGSASGVYTSSAVASPSSAALGVTTAASAPIGGLAAGRTYYYRVRTTTTKGMIYGSERKLQTALSPVYLPFVTR